MFNLRRKLCAAFIMVFCMFNVVYAYVDGNGAPSEPYRIANVSHWQQLMSTSADWNKYFVMVDDIDLQGVTLTPVGNATTRFAGVFDGNGFVIYNAYIKAEGITYIGLFGQVDSAGRIKNLGAENVDVNAFSNIGGLAARNYGVISNCYTTGKVGSGSYCGGITGRNDGYIVDCYSTCAVIGTSNVGGLAGSSTATSDVNACYSTGTVIGTDNYTGGLMGYNAGDIINSYAKGSVYGSNYTGGLTGYTSSGSVRVCYSAGKINGITNAGGFIGYKSPSCTVADCFWDVNSSGKSTSAGGSGVIGKTTAEMHDLDTFLAASWDFATPVWEICDGTNYPKLAFQMPLNGDFVCPDGVDYKDLDYFVDRWLDTNCAATNNCGGTDLNLDEVVNFKDFALLTENWMLE